MAKTIALLITVPTMMMFYIGFYALFGSFYIKQTVLLMLVLVSYVPLSTILVLKDIRAHKRLKAERMLLQSQAVYPSTMKTASVSYGSHTENRLLFQSLMSSLFLVSLVGSTVLVSLYGVISTLHRNDVGTAKFHKESFELTNFKCKEVTVFSHVCTADVNPNFSGSNWIYLTDFSAGSFSDSKYELSLKDTLWGTSIERVIDK
ncbi:hypothetical protein LRP49_19360 [Enterovibrio sp. ZSDZ35]|uniref:Uncharacterized protein n=1 Tax=Enterovibrio qingdaonensis TaxID=2899818 RepID=A0ABT5QQT0_9GAMM|nr:hypothetical protein [Enterovibrio sp. ZSDZ35]MDD1783332.1 hypothetical protein [Enterovibrio sp. ZSDZ35]